MADGLQDAPRHAGHVVRRVLLRRNIAIDAETAQLVADAVQAALRADAPSRPPRRPQCWFGGLTRSWLLPLAMWSCRARGPGRGTG